MHGRTVAAVPTASAPGFAFAAAISSCSGPGLRRVCDQEERDDREHRHRREVLLGVERHARIEMDVRRKRARRREADRVAVRRCFGDDVYADHAAGTARFSITTCWPIFSDMRGAIARAIRSELPPGGNGTT
jgi:hypothetical protein